MKTEKDYYAAANAAASAHGMLRVLLETQQIPEIHRPQVVKVLHDISDAIWPGDEKMKVGYPAKDVAA